MPRVIEPVVKTRNKEGLVKLRAGKGFSLSELKLAGLTPEKARKLGIPVDKRRKSVHEENVKRLREFLAAEAQ